MGGLDLKQPGPLWGGEQGQPFGFRIAAEGLQFLPPLIGRDSLELHELVDGRGLPRVDQVQQLLPLVVGKLQLLGHRTVDGQGQRTDQVGFGGLSPGV